MSLLSAADALEVLDIYRALGETERGRVYGFVSDALRREAEPKEAAAYAALETFALFIREVREGYSGKHTRDGMELSQAQYDRIASAWQARPSRA